MACAAHDPLLDVPGVGADFEHFQIVVRFQDQEIGFAQVVFYQLRHVAQVCDDRYFFAVGAKRVAYWIGSIVRDCECRDFDIADYEFDTGPDVDEAFDSGFWAILVHLQHFPVREFRQIGGTFPIACELGQAVGMIAVFVGDEDGVYVFGTRAAQRFEAAQHFFATEASVNQKGRAPRLEQRAVAGTSRRQN